MHLVRRTSILFVAVAVLVTASTALGSFSAGIYRTKPPTSRTGFLDFSFKATRSNVPRIRFDFRKPGACTDGATFLGDEIVYTNSTGGIPPAAIKRNGSFNISRSHSGSAPGTLTIAGRLNGQTATGTLRVRATFEGGTVTCDTGNMAWRAFKLG